MPPLAPDSFARLVSGIHAPRCGTLEECLERWRALAPGDRAASYLVVESDRDGSRLTLNAARIEALARSAGAP